MHYSRIRAATARRDRARSLQRLRPVLSALAFGTLLGVSLPTVFPSKAADSAATAPRTPPPPRPESSTRQDRSIGTAAADEFTLNELQLRYFGLQTGF